MNQISNHFKRIKRKPVFILVLCFGVLAVLAGGQVEEQKPVLVLPFKVSPLQEKAHQWLGRAVSYYITSGLERNALPVLSDQHAVSILEMNHIMLPYNITKASVIRLARENQLGRIVWGEIILGDETNNVTGKSPIRLRSFIIDTDDLSQQYLPQITGNINDLFKIENELLTSIVKKLNPGEQEVKSIYYPRFYLNYRGYELFVKSLLIKDPLKRIQLLEKARIDNKEKNSSILNLELAKLYFKIIYTGVVK
jgi:hypothetical protein